MVILCSAFILSFGRARGDAPSIHGGQQQQQQKT